MTIFRFLIASYTHTCARIALPKIRSAQHTISFMEIQDTYYTFWERKLCKWKQYFELAIEVCMRRVRKKIGLKTASTSDCARMDALHKSYTWIDSVNIYIVHIKHILSGQHSTGVRQPNKKWLLWCLIASGQPTSFKWQSNGSLNSFTAYILVYVQTSRVNYHDLEMDQ